MPRRKPKWERSDFLLLDAVDYCPDPGLVRVRFRNQDVGEIQAVALWRDRPGLPDWSRVHIDPATHSTLLVPTLAGHPTLEGETAAIPSDVLRAGLDEDYRAHLARLAKSWAEQTGRQLAQMCQARGLSPAAVARRAGLDEASLAQIESGQAEPSLATVNKLLTALGACLDDLVTTPSLY